MEKKTGLTKTAGWQFGIRKTVDGNVTEVWDFLFSENAAEIWLKGANQNFSTCQPFSHIRTKWKLGEWPNYATLQMRVLSNKNKTTIAFHIENLRDEHQRQEADTYWNETLAHIMQMLKQL